MDVANDVEDNACLSVGHVLRKIIFLKINLTYRTKVFMVRALCGLGLWLLPGRKYPILMLNGFTYKRYRALVKGATLAMLQVGSGLSSISPLHTDIEEPTSDLQMHRKHNHDPPKYAKFKQGGLSKYRYNVTEFDVLPGRKYPVVMANGYTYKRYRAFATGEMQWRCSKWHDGCRATLRTSNEDPNSEIVFLPVKKKHPIMVCDRYVYKRIRVNSSGKVFWRCVMVHNGCKAYCLADDEEVILVKDHNHEPPKYRTKSGRWVMEEDQKKTDESNDF